MGDIYLTPPGPAQPLGEGGTLWTRNPEPWRLNFSCKIVFFAYFISGCARRGASGALFPKSAYAGLNSRPRILYLEPLDHFDWTPRNRRSWTSSDPEGSSDKWCGLCPGLISICIMWRGFQKGSTAGAQPSYEISDFNNVGYLILLWLIHRFNMLSHKHAAFHRPGDFFL